MSWTVVYSAQAKQDLRNIFEYIAHSLCSPDAAKSQTRRIMAEIHSLDEMPLRYRLYDDEPWRSQGLRFFPVDHYLVFYLPVASANTVKIVRIMYGGRDVKKHLEEEL